MQQGALHQTLKLFLRLLNFGLGGTRHSTIGLITFHIPLVIVLYSFGVQRAVNLQTALVLQLVSRNTARHLDEEGRSLNAGQSRNHNLTPGRRGLRCRHQLLLNGVQDLQGPGVFMVAHHKVVALALHPDNQSLVHLLETTGL